VHPQITGCQSIKIRQIVILREELKKCLVSISCGTGRSVVIAPGKERAGNDFGRGNINGWDSKKKKYN